MAVSFFVYTFVHILQQVIFILNSINMAIPSSKIISALSLNVWNTLEVSELSAGVYTVQSFNASSKGNSIRFVKL
jgi:hypothetical protein